MGHLLGKQDGGRADQDGSGNKCNSQLGAQEDTGNDGTDSCNICPAFLHWDSGLGTDRSADLKRQAPPVHPGDPLFHRPDAKSAHSAPYLAMCSFEMVLPIVVNVVMIWLADVSRKNLLASVAQFCSSVEVGSPPVSTCT